jgi:D-3-phosphoglycerate dehydrogenase
MSASSLFPHEEEEEQRMSDVRKKVLITSLNYSEYCAEAKQLLESSGCMVIENKHDRPFLTFEELERIVPDIDAAIIGLDVWDERVFKLAPKLKIISKFGVGVDNIDVAKAEEYGIKVSNVPGGNSNAVAELAIGLMLGTLRNITIQNQAVKKASWDQRVGWELRGKTVGLLGFGNIAQLVASKLMSFGVKLLAYDKYPNTDKARQYDVTLVSLEEVLEQSDVVSMHLPSMPETNRLMSRERFNQMKDGAYFINTARGALVDEEALYEALKSGKLSAAAIDVFEQEPAAADNPLLTLDNLITLPHTAAETYETYRTVGMTTAKATLDVLAGNNPHNWVQPQA